MTYWNGRVTAPKILAQRVKHHGGTKTSAPQSENADENPRSGNDDDLPETEIGMANAENDALQDNGERRAAGPRGGIASGNSRGKLFLRRFLR